LDIQTILTLILGTTASLLFIASGYVITRKATILLQTIAISILVIQFGFITSIISVAVLNLLVVIRNIIFYSTRWEKYYNKIGAVSIVVLIGVSLWLQIIPDIQNGTFSIISILPVTALVLTTFAVMTQNVLKLKIFFMLGSLSWVTFDIILGLWGNLLGDGFSAIANAIAITRIIYMRTKEQKLTNN
jgi:hypothetical protein